MASTFESALLRLKAALQVATDKEVAEALGMSPNALNERKRRDSFPADKVRSLAAEKGFDAEYVIEGVAQAAREMIQAARDGRPMMKVGPQERLVLAHFLQCGESDRRMVLALLKRLSGDQPGLTPEGNYPDHTPQEPLVLHDGAAKKGKGK